MCGRTLLLPGLPDTVTGGQCSNSVLCAGQNVGTPQTLSTISSHTLSSRRPVSVCGDSDWDAVSILVVEMTPGSMYRGTLGPVSVSK